MHHSLSLSVVTYACCLPIQIQEQRKHKNILEEINQVLLRNILPKQVADHFLVKSNQVHTSATYTVLQNKGAKFLFTIHKLYRHQKCAK